MEVSPEGTRDAERIVAALEQWLAMRIVPHPQIPDVERTRANLLLAIGAALDGAWSATHSTIADK